MKNQIWIPFVTNNLQYDLCESSVKILKEKIEKRLNVKVNYHTLTTNVDNTGRYVQYDGVTFYYDEIPSKEITYKQVCDWLAEKKWYGTLREFKLAFSPNPPKVPPFPSARIAQLQSIADFYTQHDSEKAEYYNQLIKQLKEFNFKLENKK